MRNNVFVQKNITQFVVVMMQIHSKDIVFHALQDRMSFDIIRKIVIMVIHIQINVQKNVMRKIPIIHNAKEAQICPLILAPVCCTR